MPRKLLKSKKNVKRTHNRTRRRLNMKGGKFRVIHHQNTYYRPPPSYIKILGHKIPF